MEAGSGHSDPEEGARKRPPTLNVTIHQSGQEALPPIPRLIVPNSAPILPRTPVLLGSPRTPGSVPSELRMPLTPAEAQNLIFRRSSQVASSSLHPRNAVPASVSGLGVDELAELMAGSRPPLLIDVRPVALHSASRLRGAISLCAPSTLLKRQTFGFDRMVDLVAPEDQHRLRDIEAADHVILYDQGTTDLYTCGQNALFHSICKVAASEKAKHHLWYLQGGYSAFEPQFGNLVDTTALDPTSPTAASAAASTNSTPFNLRPVLTSLKASPPVWGRTTPSQVAEVDNTRLELTKEMLANINDLPLSLRRMVQETQKNKNPLADKFRELQSDEQARITQAFSRDPRNSASSARSPGRMLSASSTSPLALTPLTAHDDVGFQYTLCTGNDHTKNRYTNICPYDHSRVLLNGEQGYINASYVGTSSSKMRYIATQAPVPNSFGDFWKVVHDHRVPCIVMLTELATQGGQIKSHIYWEKKEYGDIEVVDVTRELVCETTSSSLTIQRITIQKTGDPSTQHQVAHMQYSDWTDLGRPRVSGDVLALVRAKRRLTTEFQARHNGSEWVVVHCSAGCGRTGTFCVIDSVIDYYEHQGLQAAKADDVDRIHKSVQELRCQRLGLVQVQRQFALCYEVVLLWYLREQLQVTSNSPRLPASADRLTRTPSTSSHKSPLLSS